MWGEGSAGVELAAILSPKYTAESSLVRACSLGYGSVGLVPNVMILGDERLSYCLVRVCNALVCMYVRCIEDASRLDLASSLW